VPEPRAPVTHLLRGAEELLRGAADALALARGRIEDADADPLSRALDTLGDWLSRGEHELLADLRDALRAEHARWELRADGDAAAQRVADLIGALLEILDPEVAPARGAGAPRRSGPRAWRTARGRPREAR
jgi:hypothetical protein